jgi:hypothetical protein
MPTQALIRYLTPPQVEKLITDAKLAGVFVVEPTADGLLVKCHKDDEEIAHGERASRALALQAICDADSALLPKTEPDPKPSRPGRDREVITTADVGTVPAAVLTPPKKPR